MPPQRRKTSIGGGGLGRNPLSDESEHTPPVSPLRDAKWPRTPQLSKAATAVLLSPMEADAPQPKTAPATTPPPKAAQPETPPPKAAQPETPQPETPQSTTPPPKTPQPKAAPEQARSAVALVPAESVPPVADPAPSVLDLPLPTAGGEGPLSRSETEQLEVCESSIDALRVAFWTAGRALQIVRDGRLYRADHATFDDYVEKRWDMQRSYAHKLIRAWPLAARLHPVAPSINEGQIRELLPIAAAHGEEAAVTVYTTLAADVKVTAGKLREAVAVLPGAHDEGEVVRRLHAWLRGDLAEEPQRSPDVFSSVETRLAALTQKVVKGSTDHPVAAREFAAKLRTLAELIERQIPNN
ncbi:hypothetical protein D7D52_02905 [Nocardia yunnanensis]|uniref:Uncharacterized protein n=1 Tax=Nocardia yunnanensis TaxID=2382165 RepID=A0A386Z5Q4_9NOCA|nr:hypothetical protein [Nocardia yunnanensis]AYF72991.1 hypothetical protein D7D52_02905 [Nocardia yunnanensis]